MAVNVFLYRLIFILFSYLVTLLLRKYHILKERVCSRAFWDTIIRMNSLFLGNLSFPFQVERVDLLYLLQ